MRAFILALLLGVTATACSDSEQEDAAEDAVENGAPAGDREDVLGDGEVDDEEGEPE